MKFTAKATLAERFEIALEEAVDEFPGETAGYLAHSLIHSNPDIIAEYTPEWQLQAVMTGIRRKRTELAKRIQKTQMLFPEFEEQFSRIPKRIPIADGKRVQRGKLTYEESRKFLRNLRKSQLDKPQVVQAQMMTALLYKHSRKNKDITWDEVVEREAGSRNA